MLKRLHGHLRIEYTIPVHEVWASYATVIRGVGHQGLKQVGPDFPTLVQLPVALGYKRERTAGGGAGHARSAHLLVLSAGLGAPDLATLGHHSGNQPSVV